MKTNESWGVERRRLAVRWPLKKRREGRNGRQRLSSSRPYVNLELLDLLTEGLAPRRNIER